MTPSTAPRRSLHSGGSGASKGTFAAASVFFARTMRCCTVATGTSSIRAISSVVRPPTTRRVNATCASRESTGWHAVNTSRSRSSSIGCHSSSPASSRSCAIVRYRSSSRSRRRQPSIALRFATAVSQAPAFCGTPDSGHCFSASTTASWARSSARPRSPVTLASVATMRPLSMRQTASTARRMSGIVASALLRFGGQLFAPGGLLLDVLVVGVVAENLFVSRDTPHFELASRAKRAAARPLGGLLPAGDIDDPETVEQFVDFTVGAVRDNRLLRREVDHETLLGGAESFAGEHHARFHHRLVVGAHRIDDLLEVDLLAGFVCFLAVAHDQHELHCRSPYRCGAAVCVLLLLRRMKAGRIDIGEKFLTRRRPRSGLLTPTHLDAPRGQQTRSWSRRQACLGKLGWSRQARPASAAPSYLTAPAVSPPTMYFCRKRNSAITGAAAMIAPAENALQSA